MIKPIHACMFILLPYYLFLYIEKQQKNNSPYQKAGLATLCMLLWYYYFSKFQIICIFIILAIVLDVIQSDDLKLPF